MGRLVRLNEQYTEVLDALRTLQIERNTAVQQRDDARRAVELRDAKLREWQAHERDVKLWAMGVDGNEDATLWETRLLWGGGGLAGGIVVGLLLWAFTAGGE